MTEEQRTKVREAMAVLKTDLVPCAHRLHSVMGTGNFATKLERAFQALEPVVEYALQLDEQQEPPPATEPTGGKHRAKAAPKDA